MGPLLEYASPVWDPYTASCISSIEKVQRSAAKWAVQDCKPTSSVTAMLEELDGPLLQLRWKKAILGTLYKFRRGLLKIDSKYVLTTENQKSHCQTNSCSFDVPFHSFQYRQDFLPLHHP